MKSDKYKIAQIRIHAWLRTALKSLAVKTDKTLEQVANEVIEKGLKK